MAKVSKLNIAITGDSKGFTRATEQAAKSMKKLTGNAAATKNNLSAMKGGFNQTSEALAKFGVQSRSLQMLGGLAGLAAIGSMSKQQKALLAAAGAIGVATLAVGSVVNMVQAIPEQRKQAIEALKQNKRDDRVGLERFGFTSNLAKGAASQPEPNATTGMGFFAGASRGFASQNTPGSRIANRFINDLPGAFGVKFGMMLGGASGEEADAEAARAMSGDDPAKAAAYKASAYNDSIAMWNKMKGWASF